MFGICNSLTRITCLATNLGPKEGSVYNYSSIDLFVYEFGNFNSTGTFYKAASMDNWPTGTQENMGSGIPNTWTVADFVE